MLLFCINPHFHGKIAILRNVFAKIPLVYYKYVVLYQKSYYVYVVVIADMYYMYVVLTSDLSKEGENMTGKQKKLAREQLDETMKSFESLKTMSAPRKGWIRAIRDTLGMTGVQLSKRLKVNQQRVARIEQDEVLGKVTLNTMQNAAEAMDCVFVYGVVARDSLEQIVRRQVGLVAKKRMARSNQMMRLEKQELSEADKAKAMQTIIDEIVETTPKSLWDEK
jgi:predicted DNA-binding mobile mystery protein A